MVEYDGSAFSGSQYQAGVPTVQAALEEAIYRLTGEKVRITAASRTDAGVHALGQVVSFKTTSPRPLEAFVGGMNYWLPAAVAVREAHVVPLSFDVRRRATSRHYRYSILLSRTRSPLRERYAYRLAGELDVAAMDRACRILVGKHDFASFAAGIGGEAGNTVRRVYHAGVRQQADMVIFDMVANAFLRHQVRVTAGCLVRVGQGKMTEEELRAVLEARRPGLAGPTLPAHGLCLVKVEYARPFEEAIT